MATFYLLPPRPLLRERLTGSLAGLFPGLDCGAELWAGLIDLLGQAAERNRDVFVIFREELPHDEAPARALVDGFGAEDGDEVIEVSPGPIPGQLTASRWRVAA